MRRTIRLAVFILAIIAAGCSGVITSRVIEGKGDYNDNVELKAYFCPRHDCGFIMQEAINAAQKSVHCAFFELNLKEITQALAHKSHVADVKVVVDKRGYDGQIKGVKIADSRYYMHNKFCIIDGKIVVTGSANPTSNDAKLNNNNLLILDSEYLAQNYEDEFEELWSGIYSGGNPVRYWKLNSSIGQIENYFCPEDCKEGGIYRVIDLAKKAEKSIKVAAFSFTYEELADELVRADIRGVNVTVVVERSQRNAQNSQYERLKDFGISIRLDGNKRNMHHKFIVIDDKILVVGSPNFSLSGNNRNDENMLIFYNEKLALGFSNEFNYLFDIGNK